jgi:hypothetical protein
MTHEAEGFYPDVDMDVFDSMRALLDAGADLDDRVAIERTIINPYEDDPSLSDRFIDWCIKAAKANLAAGLEPTETPGGPRYMCGFVPKEFD